MRLAISSSVTEGEDGWDEVDAVIGMGAFVLVPARALTSAVASCSPCPACTSLALQINVCSGSALALVLVLAICAGSVTET